MTTVENPPVVQLHHRTEKEIRAILARISKRLVKMPAATDLTIGHGLWCGAGTARWQGAMVGVVAHHTDDKDDRKDYHWEPDLMGYTVRCDADDQTLVEANLDAAHRVLVDWLAEHGYTQHVDYPQDGNWYRRYQWDGASIVDPSDDA